MVGRSRRWAWIFLSLPLATYTVVVVGPTLYSFYFSLTDWNILKGTHKFIGLANFTRLFHDSEFWQAFSNTAIWTVAGLLASLVIGFALAFGLSRTTWGSRLIKSMFFMPLALSLVVVGFIWFWLYRLDFGLLDMTLRHLGLGNLVQDWLANPKTALPSVIVAWTWQQISLSMIIFLAGLTAVPVELFEAAQVDGARLPAQIRHVIIPSIGPAISVVISLALINALKSFDIVYVMTQGGPYGKTETLSVMTYREAFKKYDFGYSSATAVVLFMLTILIIGSYTYLSKRGSDDHS